MADQDIDALCSKIATESIGDNASNMPPEYHKFKYPLLMESQIRKLKHSLDAWKEIVLKANRVLLWELTWYPTAIFAGTTTVFMFIWLIQPNPLTLVALSGLLFTIADYLMPALTASVFKQEQWTAKKEAEFEEICTNLILFKSKTELTYATYYKMKKTNSRMYYILTIAFLLILAWIGCTVNNLLLVYITVNVVLFTPGIIHHGLINKEEGFLQPLWEVFDRARLMVGQHLKKE